MSCCLESVGIASSQIGINDCNNQPRFVKLLSGPALHASSLFSEYLLTEWLLPSAILDALIRQLAVAQGKMRMVGANTVEGQGESEMLRLAAAVEGSTRHPLADAVLLAANNKHIQV